MISLFSFFVFFFFFNDTATTEIYTLSLHDALPISIDGARLESRTNWSNIPRLARWCSTSLFCSCAAPAARSTRAEQGDRKSTRLNSSHLGISYAVFCLKKKKKIRIINDHHTDMYAL